MYNIYFLTEADFVTLNFVTGSKKIRIATHTFCTFQEENEILVTFPHIDEFVSINKSIMNNKIFVVWVFGCSTRFVKRNSIPTSKEIKKSGNG